ncbi:acyl-CoA reductase-like NAD-dependent aldehyde dehydrogenase [Sinorhizobium fredii]
MKPLTIEPFLASSITCRAASWAIVDIRNRAGRPKGVLNLVRGKSSVVGQAMLDSPDVQAITFTGSTGTGKRVAIASVEHNRKFQLEMGGKNPFVVLDDADLSVAVEAAVNSAFFSTGQRCTASSRVIVTEGIHDKFVAAMGERMKGLVVDDALKAGTHIGPVQRTHETRPRHKARRSGKTWSRRNSKEGCLSVTGPLRFRPLSSAQNGSCPPSAS